MDVEAVQAMSWSFRLTTLFSRARLPEETVCIRVPLPRPCREGERGLVQSGWLDERRTSSQVWGESDEIQVPRPEIGRSPSPLLLAEKFSATEY